MFAHGSGASYNAWLFQPTVWQYGGNYSDEKLNIKINEAGAVAAGQMWLDSIKNGWATAPQDNEVDFTNGLTATTMASTGGLNGLTAQAKFELKTAFLPKGPAGPGVCTGGSGLAVIAKAPKERQEAAFKLAATGLISIPNRMAFSVILSQLAIGITTIGGSSPVSRSGVGSIVSARTRV